MVRMVGGVRVWVTGDEDGGVMVEVMVEVCLGGVVEVVVIAVTVMIVCVRGKVVVMVVCMHGGGSGYMKTLT